MERACWCCLEVARKILAVVDVDIVLMIDFSYYQNDQLQHAVFL